MQSMRLTFTKMQGAGNDFVVINALHGLDPGVLAPEQIRRIADRKFGVGADQVLVVEPASDTDSDFNYRIFNADGGEVEQCGNGARCFVRFVVDQGLAAGPAIRVRTKSGVIVPRLTPHGDVEVDMGQPLLAPESLPFDVSGLLSEVRGGTRCYAITGPQGQTLWVEPVSMGNPHLVQWIDDIDHHPVAPEGRFLQESPRLPRSVNAGFAQWLSPSHILLRVFERGAGETLSCGTGACAAAVSGIAQGRLNANGPIRVDTRGGTLTIRWSGNTGDPVLMSGPATTVFQGEMSL
jgi:diaminopimelate epimerase